MVPLADKSCTLSIIQRVVKYLQKHAEFEKEQTEDEVAPRPTARPLFIFSRRAPIRQSVGTCGNSSARLPGCLTLLAFVSTKRGRLTSHCCF